MVLAAAAAAVCAGSRARGDDPPGRDLPLRILYLFDSSDGVDPSETPAHVFLEGPANHLGLRFDRHDLATGLPPDEVTSRCRGLVTWFRDERLPRADAYLRWFARKVGGGLRALVVDGLGASWDATSGRPASPEARAAALASLGLEHHQEYTNDPGLIEVARKDRTVVEHERRLDRELRWFDGYRAMDPDARVHLALRRTDGVGGECHAVVATRAGAFVAPGYAIWYEPVAPSRSQWRIDPTAILSEAFALDGLPRLDPTTLGGARVVYAHLDGDGFESASLGWPGRLCAEVVRDEVLARMRLPVTVGIIAAPLDPDGLGRDHPERLAIARSIFELPNVEPASHTHTHPFDWTEGTSAYGAADRAFDPVAEVTSSAALLERLVLPPGKRLAAILWSGDCKPPGRAIAAASARGLANLNGSETRIDRRFSSTTGQRPWYRIKDGALQVHASMPNENVYTHGWKRSFDGLRHVIETWERTGRPRRSPVNLFFHFYSGERRDSVAALRGAIAWIHQQADLVPVEASRWCALVQGFERARVRRLDDGAYEVADRGALATVRFDGEERVPDLERCEGVMGWLRVDLALYVHLAAEGPARIRLAAPGARRPRLERSTVRLEAFAVEPDGTVRLRAVAAPWGHVAVAGLSPGRPHRLRVGDGPELVVPADALGRIDVDLGEHDACAVLIAPAGP